MLKKLFDEFTFKFSSALVLEYPDQNLFFIVETDSCNFAIGAILSQTSLKDNKVLPIVFSWSLTPTEQNYLFFDKELLVIIPLFQPWQAGDYFLSAPTLH